MNNQAAQTPTPDAPGLPFARTIPGLIGHWRQQAATCRADAERLGESGPAYMELLRDAAQYEQTAHQLQTISARALPSDWVAVPRDAIAALPILRALADAAGLDRLPDPGNPDDAYPITGAQSTVLQWYRAMLAAAPEPLAQGGTVDWTDKELAAIREMMGTQGLSYPALVRQAVRMYQHDLLRRRAGETCTWSGDAQRAREFAGDIASPQPAANLDRELIGEVIDNLRDTPVNLDWANRTAEKLHAMLTANPPQPSASVGERARELLDAVQAGTHQRRQSLVYRDDALRAIESALTTAAGGGENGR